MGMVEVWCVGGRAKRRRKVRSGIGKRVPDEVVVYRFRSVVLFNGLGGQTNE